MAVRVRFIYLLFIISVSFVIFIGCEDNCSGFGFCLRDSSGNPIDPPPPEPEPPCASFEHECNGECISIGVNCCSPFSDPSVETICSLDKPICCDGECIPIGVDCCTTNFGGDLGACTESEPKCCFGGICVPEEDSCPDVTECPENLPQPCGPLCIEENRTCCTDFHVCPESLPICCPSGTFPFCVTSPDECCDGTGCN